MPISGKAIVAGEVNEASGTLAMKSSKILVRSVKIGRTGYSLSVIATARKSP